MKRGTLPFVYDIGGSTLVGTAHIIPKQLYDERFSRTLPEMAEFYLDGKETAAFETDIGALASGIDGSIYESKHKLGETLGSEIRALDNVVKTDIAKIGTLYGKRASKIFRTMYDDARKTDDLAIIAMTAYTAEMYCMQPIQLDAEFYYRAKDMGKALLPLESVEEQMQALKKVGGNVDARKMIDIIKEILEGTAQERAMRAMFVPYVDGDIASVMREVSSPENSASFGPVFYDRNPKFYERSRPLFNDPKNIIFVGVGHCPYITDHAASDGFSVKRLS
ncbi:MAG: TraB/GumN family protein [Candidatus Aenigmarchaeota archaeon]|nr:TraB/GumN family protein [Candidatus Aenigmarchaeota archaeon]